MKKMLIMEWFHYSAIYIMLHKIGQISIMLTKFILFFKLVSILRWWRRWALTHSGIFRHQTFRGGRIYFKYIIIFGNIFYRAQIILNDTLRGCFSNSKLIDEEDYPKSLQNYSNQVMNVFVNNQPVFFPNGQFIIDAFIIQAGDILDSVIINDRINISEMPVVKLLGLLL